MTKTVVGLFDSMNEAQTVVQDLIDSGFDAKKISLVANDANGEYKNYGSDGKETKAAEGAGTGAVGGTVAGGIVGLLVGLGALAIPGIGPVLAAGPLAAAVGSTAAVVGGTALGAGVGAAAGGLIGGLVGYGIPEEDAQLYAEGVRRGGTLVTVQSDDAMADKAYDVMQNHGAVDIDDRSANWRQGGWSGFDAKAQPYSSDEINTFRSSASTPAATSSAARTTQTTTTTSNTAATTSASDTTVGRTNAEGQTVLPVVEEELKVGKREVQRGGVRVFTHVEERPVEEQVNLREERVTVERRPVDRAVTDADMAAFKEGSIEMTETAEEAVVSKTARVIEEVVIDKDVQQRTETVRDTVRRTDVDVEQIPGETHTSSTASTTTSGTSTTGTSTTGFDAYDSDFRNNYQTNFAKSGYSYDQFSPVYRYGYTLGSGPNASGDWSTAESDARTRWEERNPGTWEQFKDAIHYAWDRARGRS